jgi:hypothetical protein
VVDLMIASQMPLIGHNAPTGNTAATEPTARN